MRRWGLPFQHKATPTTGVRRILLVCMALFRPRLQCGQLVRDRGRQAILLRRLRKPVIADMDANETEKQGDDIVLIADLTLALVHAMNKGARARGLRPTLPSR